MDDSACVAVGDGGEDLIDVGTDIDLRQKALLHYFLLHLSPCAQLSNNVYESVVNKVLEYFQNMRVIDVLHYVNFFFKFCMLSEVVSEAPLDHFDRSVLLRGFVNGLIHRPVASFS